MDIVFVHGWGFGPDIWHPLAKQLEGQHHFINLGFIKEFPERDPLPERPIVIGHSLGVLWALKHIEQPAALVSIAGFQKFPATPALKAMKRRLKKDPAGLMHDFWAQCDSPLSYDFARLNTEKLAEGLGWLENWEADIQNFNCPILPLAAKNDKIISKTTTIEEWNDVHWSESGGHMLPLTQTSWCAEIIEGFLEHAVNTQGNHCK